MEDAWRKSSGIAPMRGRLEVSKMDHEAGGGSAGEERSDRVEEEGQSHRAEELNASTQPTDVLGGSRSRSSGHLYKADFQTCVPALKSLP